MTERKKTCLYLQTQMLWGLRYNWGKNYRKRKDFKEVMDSDYFANQFCNVPDNKCADCRAYEYMSGAPLDTLGGWEYLEKVQRKERM